MDAREALERLKLRQQVIYNAQVKRQEQFFSDPNQQSRLISPNQVQRLDGSVVDTQFITNSALRLNSSVCVKNGRFVDGRAVLRERVKPSTTKRLGKIKYLFSVLVEEEGNEFRDFYVGGHQRKPIFVRRLDAADSIQAVPIIDNLGKDKYAVNLAYQTADDVLVPQFRILYLTKSQELEIIVPGFPQIALGAFGNSFWNVGVIDDGVTVVNTTTTQYVTTWKGQTVESARTLTTGTNGSNSTAEAIEQVLLLPATNHREQVRIYTEGSLNYSYRDDEGVFTMFRVDPTGTRFASYRQRSFIREVIDGEVTDTTRIAKRSVFIEAAEDGANLTYSFNLPFNEITQSGFSSYLDVNTGGFTHLTRSSASPIDPLYTYRTGASPSGFQNGKNTLEVYNKSFQKTSEKKERVFKPVLPQGYTGYSFWGASYNRNV